jgi:lipopolysaccharide/colanic/teichoic acid biosynthesis glycosyltransferase
MAKRGFDILASLAAIVLLSPLLLPIIVLLRITGEGYVFYAQNRVGRGGQLFRILKFVTMLKNSPNMAGGDITVGRDPRVLPFGHFLRKTKINELPQLFNILRGDMSVIGPRPLTPRVAALFPPQHWVNIQNLRPGLSGLGSIAFRDEEQLLHVAEDRERAYKELIVPYKLALEDWYARNQSLWIDLKLILFTIVAVLDPAFNVSHLFSGLPERSPALISFMARSKLGRHGE